MQKKLLTMAVAGALAMPAVALAQVTVYGSIDTGIKHQSKVITATGDETRLSVDSQIKKTNRWGLKGSEDLGGGLMANFTMEGGFASDTGATALTFSRYTVVGLSKGGNKIDIGRDYTLNFRTQGIYDPLSHDYGGSAGVQGDITAGVRASNSIMAAFRFGAGGVAVQYAPGEVAGDNGASSFMAFNGDMAFGPVTVGAALSSRENAAGTASTDTTNFGAAWKMGAFTFRGGVGLEEVEGGNDTRKVSLGLQYNASPTLEFRVSYYNFTTDNVAGTEIATAKVAVLNMEYKLSKRTIFYVVFDRKALEGATTFIPTGGTAANSIWGLVSDGATGIGAGISHSF